MAHCGEDVVVEFGGKARGQLEALARRGRVVAREPGVSTPGTMLGPFRQGMESLVEDSRLAPREPGLDPAVHSGHGACVLVLRSG